MKHIFYFISIFLLTIFHSAFAQTWTQKATCPFAGNEGGGAFTIGSKIYFASGKDRSFYQYDPSNDAWTKKADLPGTSIERGDLTAFAIGGKGYVGLGISEAGIMKADFWEYDPSTDSWAQKADFPGGIRIQAGSFVIDSFAYVGGGTDVTNTYYNDFYKYDPTTNIWTKRASIVAGGGYSKISSPATFSIGGYGYFCGGELAATEFNNLVRYDPLNNKWTNLAPMPGALPGNPGNGRVAASGFSNGQLGFVGFGVTGFTTGYYNFYSYDPSTNTWKQLPDFPTKAGRAYAPAAVVGNNAYVGCGWDIGSSYFNDWWQLSLPVPALVPHITVSLNQIDFGSLNANTSRDTTMNIHAGSDTNLVIAAMQISGSGSAAYSIKNPPAFPYTLAAGKDLSLTITYKPADTGTFDATLTITSDAERETAHATPISLHGTAISLTPHILFSSTKIDYGKVNLNTSVDSILTITAGQNADLKIANIQLTEVGDPSNAFTLKSLPAFPFTLSAGKDLKVGITFKPSSAQPFNATVNVTSNAENETPHTSLVTIHGEGVGADAVASEDQSLTKLKIVALPNPFSQNTILSLTVKGSLSERVKINVIDALGNEVLNLGEKDYESGNHNVNVDAGKLSSGKYWIVAKSSHDILSIPLVKVR